MKSGFVGTVGILKTVATPNDTVKDTFKQCPGDKFVFTCEPKATFTAFDIKTGAASIKAPRLDKNMDMKCKLTKTAANRVVEVKEFKFVILAMPKSQCKLNVAKIPKTMKSGEKGSVSIAMTIGSTTEKAAA